MDGSDESETDGGGGGVTRQVARRVRGGREVVSVEKRREFLDAKTAAECVTLYGGTSVQQLGGTASAHHALTLIQCFTWAKRTSEGRNSQVKKYTEFAEAEGRGMPPGEIDLVCFVGYMMYEGKVSAASFPQYLSGVRRCCEVLKLEPLPPTPKESRLLEDALKAAKRLESELPVKEIWTRAGISASQTLIVLEVDPNSTELVLRRRKALWQVLFCFSFRGGTGGALWAKDFTFDSDFRMAIKPDVLKRTSSECTRNPESRPYCVPHDTPAGMNPIKFIRSVVEEFAAEHGEAAFIFSSDVAMAGNTEFVTAEIVAMAAIADLTPAEGTRFMSHSPRRGMLTEFILQHPRPDDIVIARRMDWGPKANNTVTYFSRDVVRSDASAIYVPGALQVQVEASE